MADTFWSDILVALFGAALTVGIGYGSYRFDRRRRETLSLNSLIGELSRRRALVAPPLRRIPGAENLPDFLRANASVMSIRDEVRRVRDIAQETEEFQPALSEMTRACNRYLELGAMDPDGYYLLLDQLRRELDTQVVDLCKSKRLKYLEPGSGAF